MNSLTVRIDPLGNRTSYAYDLNSRLTKVKNSLGAIMTSLFDLTPTATDARRSTRCSIARP